jgi:hypothetical protein
VNKNSQFLHHPEQMSLKAIPPQSATIVCRLHQRHHGIVSCLKNMIWDGCRVESMIMKTSMSVDSHVFCTSVSRVSLMVQGEIANSPKRTE